MAIKKLPQYLINQLKAGEIVERPASIVKELLENSLDAGSTHLTIELAHGGKERIIVRDNGHGVSYDDLPKMIERYATSKIHESDDLLALMSYGFRGEALSAIAEVSSFCVQTKVVGEQAYELKRSGSDFTASPVAFAGDHGTHVIVDQLFAAIPVREKYLKSDATEWKYIRQLVMTYALVHFDKQRTLVHNGKKTLHLPVHESVIERATHLFQSSRESKWTPFEYKDTQLHCRGVRGDASLHFPTSQHVYLVVNGRPVTDKLLRKAVLTAYQRQIVPGSYPFVVLFLDIDPGHVDVNVHPRKMEVTFLDPGSIFNLVKQTIGSSLGDQKVSYSAFTKSPIQGSNKRQEWKRPEGENRKRSIGKQESDRIVSGMQSFGNRTREKVLVQESLLLKESTDEGLSYGGIRLGEHEVHIVGQLHTMYIVAESCEGMLLIDQHALAERVTFEKMRTQTKEKGFEPEVLLTPLSVSWTLDNQKTTLLNQIGFDVSMISDTKSVVYAVPSIFQQYSIDLGLILQCLEGLDLSETYEPYQLFGLILDEIMGMKACKASIKAGQRLSIPEMEQLLRDASGMIDGLFVCQHGRPSVVLIPKGELDGLFDRH